MTFEQRRQLRDAVSRARREQERTRNVLAGLCVWCEGEVDRSANPARVYCSDECRRRASWHRKEYAA